MIEIINNLKNWIKYKFNRNDEIILTEKDLQSIGIDNRDIKKLMEKYGVIDYD